MRNTEASLRNITERKKLLDKLIGYGRLLERHSSADRTMRDRVVTANAHLKDFGSRTRYEKDMKRRLQREKRDAAMYRKKIASQISELHRQIRVTQRQLEGS